MGKHEPIAARARVAKRRATLRAQGLRPKQFWVPDTRHPVVRERLEQQAAALAQSAAHWDDIAWAESVQYWPPDDPD